MLARWRIAADAWHEFIALDARLREAPDALSNELQTSVADPVHGVTIVAGKSTVEIDGNIHRLPVRGTPEITHAEFNESRVRPSYIELHLRYPDSTSGASGLPQAARRSALRFPVPPDAKAQAQHLVAHYSGSLPGKPDFFHGSR